MHRRSFLTALGAGTASIAGCAGLRAGSTETPIPSVPLDPVDSDWPTYQFDAGRTGHNPAGGTSHDDRDGHWSAEIAPTSQSPAVVDGTVYAGGADGSMYALEATTGTQQWKVPLVSSDNEIGWTTPTVAAGTVYVGSPRALHALEVSTGKQRWEHRGKDGRFAGEDVVVVDDMVVVEPATTTIAALHADTGAVKWRYETGKFGVTTNLAIADGSVFFGTAANATHALDLATGDLLWRNKPENVHRVRDLAVADGRVFLTGATMHALDAETGEQQWVYSTIEESTEMSWLPIGRAAASGGPHASPPTIADGRVYVSTEDEKTIALDAATGTLEWNVDAGGLLTPPVVADGFVYLADGMTVRTFDTASGRRSPRIFPARESVGTPIAVDGVVFVQAGETYLQALTARKNN